VKSVQTTHDVEERAIGVSARSKRKGLPLVSLVREKGRAEDEARNDPVAAALKCPRSCAHTPSWNVGLEARRAKVKINAWIVSRCLPGGNVPGGGHSGMLWARIVKKAANRPLKNINSEPSQTTTPTASNWAPPAAVGCAGAAVLLHRSRRTF